MKRAKRYGMVLTALLCTAVLTGCGLSLDKGMSEGSNSAEGSSGKGLFGETNREEGKSSGEGLDFADSDADGQDTEDIDPEMQNANFENLGNNPNNLYQTQYCPAFDEMHIYWCEKERIVQANKDGSEARYIGKGDGWLNVYDGWLYTITNGYDKDRKRDKMEICRINLDTYEKEVLGTYVAGDRYAHPECLALLVANGYVFYSIHDGWSSQWVGMLDIQPDYIDDRILLYLNIGTISRNVEMSVGGDYLYVFIKSDGSNSYDRDVWRENISNPFTGDAWVKLFDSLNGEMWGTWMFTPEGFHRYSRRNLSHDWYVTKLYDKINEEEKTWIADTLCKDIDKKLATKSPRFLIGDTLFLLLPTDEGIDIYRYADFDFQNGTHVASAAVNVMFKTGKTAIYGIHQDSLYLVELSENGSRLIRVKADGTVESSEMFVPEQNSSQ